MKNFYEVGRVYIWHILSGELACLHGTETTVTGPAEEYQSFVGFANRIGHPTDTPDPFGQPGVLIFAEPGDLRPKNPPPSEKSIYEMFTTNKEVEEV